MNMTKKYWYEKVVKGILEANTDVLFIVDKLGFSNFSEVKSAISKSYPHIVQYEGEIQLIIWLRKKEKPLIVLFSYEKDIPYHMLSKYAVITLDTDIMFPLLDKKTISLIPFSNYQLVYDFYRDNIYENIYERLSEEDTESVIDKSMPANDGKQLNRILELESQIKKLLELQITGITEWIEISGKIAEAWGELIFLSDTIENDHSFENLRNKMEEKFKAEIVNYYDDTAYGSNLPVQWNIIDRIHRNGEDKKAIICFDCMGFVEWNALKEYLNTYGGLKFDVGHSLAIIPTETNFSRTTIFSGLPPKKVLDSGIVEKMETRHEGKLFKQALEKYGIYESNVFYQRTTGPDGLNVDFDSFHDFDWVGLVFTFMDTLTHNSLTTESKLIRDIREFLDKSNMQVFICKLLEQGFQVYFVSDHGSIYAKGNGLRVSKDLVDDKARRYMIFEHRKLAEEYKTENTLLLQLKNVIGDKWLLLVSGSEMFGNLSDCCLTHGGISIEEVVVPFVKVIKR